MKARFLPYLVCVECKSNLKLTVSEKRGEEIEEGKLSCLCGREYPVINGIPRMLPRELAKEKTKTASAFGKKWREFAEMHMHHEAQFLDWIWPITKKFFRNKLVLDAGCGQGRHVYFAAQYGAKAVLGIDLSEAVDVAHQHTRKFPNVCIVQGDIYHLPFKEKLFDYAFSIGVLHHLPDPERGFDAILEHVKPGGTFSAWVYGSQGLLVKVFNTTRKHVLARLPMPVNYGLSLLTTAVLYPVVKLVYNPLSKLTPALAKRLPQQQFFVYLGKLGFRMTHEIIYDQFIAPTAVYYTGAEFKRWFKKAKIRSFSVTERNQNSWRGTATRK